MVRGHAGRSMILYGSRDDVDRAKDCGEMISLLLMWHALVLSSSSPCWWSLAVCRNLISDRLASVVGARKIAEMTNDNLRDLRGRLKR